MKALLAGKKFGLPAGIIAMLCLLFAEGGQAQTTESFDGSATWTAPAGVTSVLVEAWGGGGGGGAATGNASNGGGGAGGQYARKSVTVVPGNNYAIVVGAGGTSSTSTSGGPGGDSGFGGATIVAKGGAGGGIASSQGGDGSAGSGTTTGGVGDLVYAGGSGSAGNADNNSCNGGGAGGGGAGSSGAGGNASGLTAGTGTATGGGDGGAGRTSSGSGYDGNSLGGGGGGACAESGANQRGGGGGAGRVVLTYSVSGGTQLCDGFESGLGNWTVDNTGGTDPDYGTAVIDTAVKHAGAQSLRMSRDWVRVTSNAVDMSSASGTLSFWVGAGLDPSSPDFPEAGDDLVVEYYNSGGVWTSLATIVGPGVSTPFGQHSTALPADAKHANFRLRFTQLRGSGNASNDYDQWHVDDVCFGTVPSSPTPLAEYRFDECSQYTGAAGEVADSAGAYAGTPMGGLQNAPAGQVLNNADFSASSRYVNVPAGPAMTGDWTISVWFKTPFADSTTHSSRYYNIGSVSGGGDFAFLDRNNGYRWGVYTTGAGGGTSNGTFRFNTLADGWHHMALVGSGTSTSLYIDGTYRDQVGRKNSGTFQYLGTSYDDAGTSNGQSFGTPLDEFKIYGRALLVSEIAAIYTNELAGNNADGSARPNPCLSCFTASFTGVNGSSPGSDWTTSSSSGTFGQPKIYSNRLRLTDATNNVATAAHLQRLFPGAGNKIVVEFDYFAYNGSGADGIALTFSDASVTPQAGAYGGSLGYAQRCGTNGFAGGWLGVGIDEYGNFRNDEECRGDGGSPTGTVPDSVSVRGSGSGTSGYLIHAESGALTPGVDQAGATAGPGHRYRVTVDHSDGVHAYVKVERNTGSGFSTIVPQYDAKTKSGQAAVPTNWLLSYTGSTGGSNNIHEIDNLSVCTTQPILPLGPASFLVSAPAAASTCGTAGGAPAAPVVTVTAKDGAGGTGNTVTSYTGTITLATSTGRGTWTKVTGQADGTLVGNQYTFVASDNGDAQFHLVSGVAENLTVTATDTATSASGTSGTVQFRDNAFVVTPTDALGTTVVAGRNHAMQVAFWKKDPTTGLCGIEASYTGSHNLDAWYTPDASHPAGATAPSIGAVSLPAADPGGQATYNLALGFTNGVATFNLATSDVGKYVLNFEDDTRSFSNAVDIAGSSATLTARPFALQATVAGNPGASAAGGTVFTSAGSNFSATVRGVLWQAADDANNDGTPDLTGAALNAALADNAAAAHFAWATTLAPDSAGYTPAGGALGGLANGSIAQGSYGSGAATATTLQYSEVGSFTLLATASNYLNSGLTLSANAGVVGRFKPHHFVLTPSLANRQGASCIPAATFTYMGEPLRISLGLVAEKEGGGTTINYDSALGFSRLDPATANWLTLGANSSLGMGAVQGTTPLNSRLSVSGTPSGNWTNGTATLLADLLFSRPATTTPDATWGPYDTLQFGALPQDADGVTLQPGALNLDADASGGNERQLAGTTKLRHGRLFLENAYGSEKLALVMPVRAEYWNGTHWVVNNDDGCSVLGSPSLASNPAGLTTTPSLGTSWAYGRGSIVLSAPNASGSVVVSLVIPDYLRYFDYDGGGFDNPRGTARFGLYKPNRAFIYQREAY